jgi:histidinol-phosphate phosphatase family protein
MIPYEAIDKSWTLFLDRDGVLNRDKEGDYIRNAGEFVLLDEANTAVSMLNKVFGITVVATNQKGVGKGLMTLNDLAGIHSLLGEHMAAAGATINKIYFAPDLDNDSPNRKPNHGMALQAQQDYPQVNFAKSIMVGNRLSDMQFGRNAGMYTVFVATTHPETPFPHPLIDARFSSLIEFARHLALIKN